jgi:exodeoxyribonuclease VII small subunit
MPKKKLNLDVGQALKELENIAAWFESGEPDLEQGLQKFEHGLELAQLLRTRLNETENRIKEIRERVKVAVPTDQAQL